MARGVVGTHHGQTATLVIAFARNMVRRLAGRVWHANRADMFNVAIIIPHYNDVVRLERCLEALMPQVSDDIEVVVADNASTVDLEPVAARWPGVRIVTQTEKGAGPARNAGVEATTAPWLMFIDADCVANPGWVARGLAIADAEAVIGGGGFRDGLCLPDGALS